MIYVYDIYIYDIDEMDDIDDIDEMTDVDYMNMHIYIYREREPCSLI